MYIMLILRLLLLDFLNNPGELRSILDIFDLVAVHCFNNENMKKNPEFNEFFSRFVYYLGKYESYIKNSTNF